MAGPGFERKPAPLAARIAAGVWMECVFAPIIWGTQKLGWAEKMLASFSDKREQEFIRKNPFRDYVPAGQDVFVMTYPKSGTNWMMQIVYQLIHHGKGEFDHIHSVVPWPDAPLLNPMMAHYAIPLYQANEWQTAPERKRIIKDSFQLGVVAVFGPGPVYCGDPRSQRCVRLGVFLHQRQWHGGRDAGGRYYVPALPGRQIPARGSSPANAAGYWAQRRRPNVLVVSFRSMKRDLEGTVRQVALFLDIRVSDEIIREVCAKSSFEYMKRIDHKFGTGKMISWGETGSMIRKGRQGGSGELLTPERQREMDAHCVAELKRLGSDLPYEEFCDLAV